MIPEQLEIREQDGRLYAVNDGVDGVHYSRYTDVGAVLPFLLAVTGSVVAVVFVVHELFRGSAVLAAATIVVYAVAVVLLRVFRVGRKITSHFVDKAVAVMYTAPFYAASPGTDIPAHTVRSTLTDAMTSAEYRVRARTIIDAGIIGFSRTATAAGEAAVSRKIADRTRALHAAMVEADTWRDNEASEITSMYLKGLDD